MEQKKGRRQIQRDRCMNFNFSRALIIVVVFIGALVVIPVIGTRSGDMSEAERLKGQADYTLTARDLAESHREAQKSYHGKVIEISGTVSGKNLPGEDTRLYIGTAETDKRIVCRFGRGNVPSLAQVNPGDSITVKGVVNITWAGLNLERSIIIQHKRRREY